MSASASTTVCPTGEFAVVGNKSFYWSGASSFWEDARVSCPTNATLAIVESAAEMQALKDKALLGLNNSEGSLKTSFSFLK